MQEVSAASATSSIHPASAVLPPKITDVVSVAEAFLLMYCRHRTEFRSV